MNWNWKFRAVWMLCLGVNDMSREMKDSGVEWIGEMPEEWKIERLQWHLQEINKPNNPVKTEYILSLNNKTGVIPYEERDNMGNKAKEDYSQYKIAYPDTLVMNSMNVIIGSVGISHYYGCISPVYYVFKASDKTELRYINYVFKIERFQKELRKYANGILEIRLRISVHDTLRRLIPIPSYEEQCKIADFLDGQCEKINLAIGKAKVSIEEYRNLKQSFITQIVTKGINENDTMKESGIEWIGKIPASWKVTQLRHCASIRSGITLGKTYSKDTELVEMPYLRVANVQDGYVDTNDIAVLQVSKDEIEKYSLSAGEVLMTEGGDRDKLGRGCVWDGRMTPCLHQNHIFAVKVKENLLNPHYLEYLTASSVGRTYFDVTAVKTTNLACTSSSKVLAFTIPLPSIEEQNEIVDYLKEKCGCIETAISKKEQFISELENYKKFLIYEYVTGKKEVPES